MKKDNELNKIESKIDSISKKVDLIFKNIEDLKKILNIKPKIKKGEVDKEVLKLIKTLDSVSTSYLQRKLGIGYARATRAMDMLKTKGFISSERGIKPRKVLKSR